MSKIDEIKLIGQICNKCKIEYPCYEGNFRKHAKGKDGFEHICNKCRQTLRKTQQAKLKNNEYMRLWRSKNKEKDLSYQKARRENPLFRAMYKAASANTKARKIGVIGILTKENIEFRVKEQESKCYYCGIDITNVYEIDHVIPFYLSGSNTLDNIVACCKQCNRSKWIYNKPKPKEQINNKNNIYKRALIQQIKEQEK